MNIGLVTQKQENGKYLQATDVMWTTQASSSQTVLPHDLSCEYIYRLLTMHAFPHQIKLPYHQGHLDARSWDHPTNQMPWKIGDSHFWPSIRKATHQVARANNNIAGNSGNLPVRTFGLETPSDNFHAMISARAWQVDRYVRFLFYFFLFCFFFLFLFFLSFSFSFYVYFLFPSRSLLLVFFSFILSFFLLYFFSLISFLFSFFFSFYIPFGSFLFFCALFLFFFFVLYYSLFCIFIFIFFLLFLLFFFDVYMLMFYFLFFLLILFFLLFFNYVFFYSCFIS